MNLEKKEKKGHIAYNSPTKFYDSNLMEINQYSMNKGLMSMHAGLQEEMDVAPSLPIIEANSDSDGQQRDHDQASLVFKPIGQLKQKIESKTKHPIASYLSPNTNSILNYGGRYGGHYD